MNTAFSEHHCDWFIPYSLILLSSVKNMVDSPFQSMSSQSAYDNHKLHDVETLFSVSLISSPDISPLFLVLQFSLSLYLNTQRTLQIHSLTFVLPFPTLGFVQMEIDLLLSVRQISAHITLSQCPCPDNFV